MMKLSRRLPRPTSLLLLALLVAGLVVLAGRRSPLHADGPIPSATEFRLKPGDHISLIGNTLADRMQHDGWLETYLQSRFPKYHLAFRDLGYSGDELTLRLRSAGFGSPDEWLTREKTDVVFAFFGYNEAYAGAAGLDKFRKDLAEFIRHTRGHKYNGKEAPRLVLFSPIAHEDLHNRNLPDGRENNKALEQYTTAMAEVAAANHVPFVDLFYPTLQEYTRAAHPLTINGVHLNERGNHFVAQVIDEVLFQSLPVVQRDAKLLEKLRQAIVDKDFYFFNRYRTVDGFNVYGGRSYERYLGQTNREVLQREMQVLDVMAANRDKRVWAVAQGKDLQVDDSDTPPFIPVKSNIRGPGPNGEFT
ncbi:MAG TPA: SGNH/GDSL hydrolase family protein, partial [Gemmataceae bacterium]|nr:SGNH/GDSL hydrolase family protein [Gemmataceae bacterium]